MTILTSVLTALTGWVAHLAARLVPSSAKNECDRVAYHGPAAEASVDTNGDDKHLKKYFIPNVIATWPWPRRLNQHHVEVIAESAAWIASFKPFNPKAQESFDRCRSGLLGCLAYPNFTRDHARIACDYMNSTWVIDEYSDVSEGREVRNQKNIVMDALRNPHKPRPEGEWICGEIIRQFWARTIKSASVQTQKRFIAIFDKFLESIVQQAIDRDGRQIRNVQSYIDMRRDTGGVRPALVLIELGLDIPDDVFLHPAIEVMMTATNDMICLSNDMLSYNVEQARGDYHNIVAIAMHEFDTDVNGAMLWVADHYKEVEKKFFEAKAALPKWGEPIDSQVRQYCDGLGSWVRGNDEWSFETERYFGSKGPEIKRKRWNMLIPKDRLQKLGPRETGPVLVDSLL